MLQRTGEGDALRWLIAVPTEDGKVTIVGNRVASVRFVGADLTVPRFTPASDPRAASLQSRLEPLHEEPEQPPLPPSRGVEEVRCWSCKAKIAVTDQNRGKKLKCSSCGTKQRLPI